jgi:predicted MFS family arabinose efflux permease
MKAGVLHPCAVLMAVAMMAGVVTTFLPIVFAPVPGTVLSLSLFLHALAAIATRWLAGRLAKPLGQARWLSLGALAAVLGITAIAAFDGPPAIVAGMILIGAGFGIVQNTSLTLLFARVPASNFPAVSALWNLAYDAGLGVGAALFGLLFGAIGHQLALTLFGALVLAALCLRPEAK